MRCVHVMVGMWLAMMGAGAGGAGEEPGAGEKPLEIKATLKVADKWMAGTVCWAEITFKNELGEVVPVLGYTNYEFKFDSYVMTLTEKKSGQVVVTKEVPRVQRIGGLRGGVVSELFRVPAFGVLSVPFRVGWPKENPGAGVYELALQPVSNKVNVGREQRSVSFKAVAEVVIVMPTEEEKKFLARPEVMAIYPFARWEPDVAAKMPESLKKYLAMELELRRIFQTPRKVDPDATTWVPPGDKSQIRQIDADRLGEGVGEFYKPLAGVLRYEVLLAQERKTEAWALKVELVKNAPGYEWLCEYAEGVRVMGAIQRGLLASMMGASRSVEKEK